MRYRYGFIGCGNMGGVLVGVVSKWVHCEKIAVCDHNDEKTAALQEELSVIATDSRELAANSECVVLGVKPQVMKKAIDEIKDLLVGRKDVIVITMAAGLSIAKIKEYLGEGFVGGVIRIMPNTPCAVGTGLILYTLENVSAEKEKDFRYDFLRAGYISKTDESKMDAASALTGCGPAFAYYVAEGLIDGVSSCGVEKADAQYYAAVTLLGAAKMLLGGDDPKELRQKVCSPKGTTLAGMKALEDGSVKQAMSDAVRAAYARALELQREE